MAGIDMPPRILVCNIYFSPSSFGGATVVAENMAVRLKDDCGWDVVVATSIQDQHMMPYTMRRYSTKGLDVIGVRLPDIHPLSIQSWQNREFDTVFGRILDHVAPDVVHVHSIQNMGAGMLMEVKRRGIPLAVTVHDYWFVCERQFMINHAGRFCNQSVISEGVCRYCVTDIAATRKRNSFVQQAIRQADLILYPSNFHRDFHVNNGLPPAISKTNKNGVMHPQRGFRRTPNPDPAKHKLRFGFVGGPGPIKGASLMAQAFKNLKRSDYELVVVDAARNIGQTWASDPVWRDVPGDVRFVDAYDQNTIDSLFCQIDVLLFPSQWKESFGLTVR
jgi:glycosyltransferase involved in cell wall biosynthesis